MTAPMMRTPQLIELARRHGLTFVSIKALQDYRKKHEVHVEQVADVFMPTEYGEFRAQDLRQPLERRAPYRPR